MEPDQVPLPWGKLVKLYWDSYDSLTAGAFSAWKPKYIAADPVFLLIEGELELPFIKQGAAQGTQMAEVKVRNEDWYRLIPQILGSEFLTGVHDGIVDTVWSALMLAVPGAGPGSPRSSVTMLIPEGGCLQLGNHKLTGLRVQGEADQEYVYSADTACTPLTVDDLVRTIDLLPVVLRVRGDKRLAPALDHLLATTDPTLTPHERLLLSVMALEALLLTDVQEGLQDTFTELVSERLGSGAEGMARQLYRARSKAVHQGPSNLDLTEIPPGLAEQLLADIIVASAGTPTTAEQTVRGFAPGGRLLPRPAWYSATFNVGAPYLAASEDSTVSWSPLLGLTYDQEGMTLPGLGARLLTLSPIELISLEEKDIARDFIAKFLTSQVPLAGLSVAEFDKPPGLDDELMTRLLRPRDLAVVSLRMAGLHEFIDPELLGWYVSQGHVRHRRETVFRQTALMRIGNPVTEHLSDQFLEGMRPIWTLLASYNATGGMRDIDRMLDTFRRTHDPYASERVRIALLFALLEAMLGRFRPFKNSIQLEHLVAALRYVDSNASAWFLENGRGLRNESAHGVWQSEQEGGADSLPTLLKIAAAALRELLEVWLDSPDKAKAPGMLLVATLQRRCR